MKSLVENKGINIIGLLGILKANLLRNHISYTDITILNQTTAKST